MLRLEKVAMPLTVTAVVVPPRVPPAGLVSSATVMLVLALVTVCPWASWTTAWTGGVIRRSGAVVLGWTLKASLAAAVGVGEMDPDPSLHPAASSATAAGTKREKHNADPRIATPALT